MKKQPNLIFNSVICLECNEQLISRHQHDYKTCSCPNETMVDGGNSYQRHGGKNLNLVQSFCIYDNEPWEVQRRYIARGGRGIDGTEPLKYVALKDIDDDWLTNIISYEEKYRSDNPQLKYYRKEQKYRKKNGL